MCNGPGRGGSRWMLVCRESRERAELTWHMLQADARVDMRLSSFLLSMFELSATLPSGLQASPRVRASPRASSTARRRVYWVTLARSGSLPARDRPDPSLACLNAASGR